MAKRPVINTISTDVSGLDTPLNENFTNVQDQFNNTVSRDGSSPNAMNSDLDMNSNDILNVKNLYLDNFYINGSLVSIDDLSIIELEGLTTFSTRTSVTLATIDEAVSYIYVQGYSTLGDGGGAFYKRVASEPSHEAKIQSNDGTWWEYVPGPEGADVRVFGAVGTNDLGAALSDAIDFALASASPGYVVVPDGSYNWDTTVNVTAPEDLKIDFKNADITVTINDIALNLNSDYDPAPATPDTERRVYLTGGNFTNSNGTKTASEMVRAYGMRHFLAEKMYIQAFWKAFVFSSKDTYQFLDNVTYDNVYHYHCPALAVRSGDKTVSVSLERCSISASQTDGVIADENGVLVEDSIGTFVFDRCTIAGETTDSQVKFVDNTLGRSTNIKFRDCYFDQHGSGGAITLADTNSTGFSHVSVENSYFTSAKIGSKAITISRTTNFKCVGTPFIFGDEPNADTSEYGIKLDSNCRNVVIEDGCRWGTSQTMFTGYGNSTPVVLNSLDRTYVTLLPNFWALDLVNVDDGTDYTPITAQSTTAATTIDMSAINTALGATGSVLPPLAYDMALEANDSGSAASTSEVGVLLRKKFAGGGNANSLRVSLDGVPNDDVRTAHGRVPAYQTDSSGDIEYVATASGTGTLDFRIEISGIHR